LMREYADTATLAANRAPMTFARQSRLKD
jgi:hypothetical protein